jgi:16S rRNA (adenine1518-N6/adenine1519-N6)-dimethyltransferase
MTIEYIRDLLKRYGLKPNETYGQNFLLNEIVLQDMVDSVPFKKGEGLLEVGPGLGSLTQYLCQTGNPVLSIEKDPKFLPVLKALRKEYKNLHFEIADILGFDFQEAMSGHDGYHVVANIPYYITGKIIQLFVQAKHKPKTITLLIQKEVAENVTAKPGRLNLLAISVQLYGEVELLQKVLARDFYPAPKVDSSVIQIKLHDRPKYEVQDEKKFFTLLRACFTGKRKQLHNTLANYLHASKSDAEKILEQVQVSTHARPQELSIGEWVKLYNAIHESK